MSLENLIVRIRKQRKNIGPRNPTGLLLDECVLAFYSLVKEIGELRYGVAERPTADVAGDSGAGIDAGNPEGRPVSLEETEHAADAGCAAEPGYGAGV